MKITANNPEQEEAEEILDIEYEGEELEIGLNVSYILDILNILKCDKVRFLLINAASSLQIEDHSSQMVSYILMPMRL